MLNPSSQWCRIPSIRRCTPKSQSPLPVTLMFPLVGSSCGTKTTSNSQRLETVITSVLLWWQTLEHMCAKWKEEQIQSSTRTGVRITVSASKVCFVFFLFHCFCLHTSVECVCYSCYCVSSERPKAKVNLQTGWSQAFSTDSLLLKCEVEDIALEWNYTWYCPSKSPFDTVWIFTLIKIQQCRKFSFHFKFWTGSRRTRKLMGCLRHIMSHPRMTQNGALTVAVVFAVRDHYIQKPVKVSRPGTFVSTNKAWKIWVLTLPISHSFFHFWSTVLKRRLLLSITGCIFFGLIAVFIGCIALRVFRKPGFT